ncbi:MAG: DNA polymerase thumb domain-containing protein [Candidatus Izemoplasmataceae bacterium]
MHEDYRIYRDILCIDLKSFFASVECALRGLDPFKTPLIVADEGRGGGSIVLAVSPYLKSKGLPSRCRLYEVPKDRKLIIAKPRMKEYLRFSREIVSIFLNYVSYEDLHIYSIDETFLDVTHYLKYHKKTPYELAETILKEIQTLTKIPATCGIGDNLLLSKLALDLYSKKAKNFIAEIRYKDIEEKLWPVSPLSEMWGIGSRMEKRLNQLNIYTVYDLAHANIKHLKRLFGVIGEELYYHAHGIDMSVISDKNSYKPHMKSVGLGQTLFKDYNAIDIIQVIKEMTDEVSEKLRFIHKEASTIHLGIRYSKDYKGGFSRQITFEDSTSDPDELFHFVMELFMRHYEDLPIRQVFIRATKLEEAKNGIQVSFFEAVKRKEKRMKLWHTIDKVRARYGKTSITRLSSHLDEGTLINRSGLIGGHHG